MKWLLLAVPWLLTTVTANDVDTNDHPHLRRGNDFEHRMLQQTCPTTTCSASVNPTIVACSAPEYVSGPCYQVGKPLCEKSGAGVRFRNFAPSGQKEIFLGTGLGSGNVGGGITSQVDRDVNWSNGCSQFTLTFNAPPTDTLILTGFGSPDMTIPSVAAAVTARSAAPSAEWNGLSIFVRNTLTSPSDGTVDLLDVKLSKADGTDEVTLGNFCVDLNGAATWTIKNFDFSAGFKISGLVARGGTVWNACAECSKIELLTMQYDDKAPIITCPIPSPLVANGACMFPMPDLTTGVASDSDSGNCGILSVTQIPAVGTDLQLGPHDVKFTATDNNGNQATKTCAGAVTVVDNTPPSITCPSPETLPATDDCKALPDWTGKVTTSDNCGVVSVTQVPAKETRLDLGNNLVTFTATDAGSKTQTCTTTVTVVDNTLPSITCPPPTTLSATADCKALLPDLTTGVASDNCGVASVTQVPAAGARLDLGSNLVTFTATDASGNVGFCTMTVTVVDNKLSSIDCGIDIISPYDPAWHFHPCDASASLPLQFTATAATKENGCSPGAIIETTVLKCERCNGANKVVTLPCNGITSVGQDTLQIANTNGVGTFISWNVKADDGLKKTVESVSRLPTTTMVKVAWQTSSPKPPNQPKPTNVLSAPVKFRGPRPVFRNWAVPFKALHDYLCMDFFKIGQQHKHIMLPIISTGVNPKGDALYWLVG